MHLRRAITVTALCAGLFVALAVPAVAHVHVDPSSAAAGGPATLTFRVPNERDVATTKVAVKLNATQPLAAVVAQPVPGWTVDVTKEKLTAPIDGPDGKVTEVVSVVTWSGGTIAPGATGAFAVTVGKLPAGATQVVFPTIQTYSDGEEVSWIDPPGAPGDPEPEHPAPTLQLTAGGGTGQGTDTHGGHGTDTTSPGSGSAPTPTVGTDTANEPVVSATTTPQSPSATPGEAPVQKETSSGLVVFVVLIVVLVGGGAAIVVMSRRRRSK